MKLQSALAILVLTLFVVYGCATTVKRPPISYLAAERPVGAIEIQKHHSVEKKFERGGWYLVNYNFRPAPDVADYLKQVHEEAGSKILKNADVMFQVPFAFDILLFGYNAGTDVLTAGVE